MKRRSMMLLVKKVSSDNYSPSYYKGVQDFHKFLTATFGEEENDKGNLD
jgi:hypothetical protein